MTLISSEDSAHDFIVKLVQRDNKCVKSYLSLLREHINPERGKERGYENIKSYLSILKEREPPYSRQNAYVQL